MGAECFVISYIFNSNEEATMAQEIRERDIEVEPIESSCSVKSRERTNFAST